MIFLNLIILSTVFLPFITISVGIKNRIDPGKNIMIAVVTNLIVSTGILAMNKINGGVIESDLQKVAEFVSENANSTGVIEGANISTEAFLASFEITTNTMLTVLPASVIMWTIIISFIAYKILYKIYTLNGKNGDLRNITEIKNFTLPREFFVGMLVIFLLAFFSSMMFESMGSEIYVNVSLILQFLFAVQGIAVVVTFLNSKRIPNAVSILLCIIIYSLPYGNFVLNLIGVIEILFGLRRRMKPSRAR